MATRKRKTRRRNGVKVRHAITRGGKVQHVLVRGSARNPVPMIASKKGGTLKRIARLLQTHFPGAKVRIRKVKI